MRDEALGSLDSGGDAKRLRLARMGISCRRANGSASRSPLSTGKITSLRGSVQALAQDLARARTQFPLPGAG
jgi:hypothetical protein